MEDFATSGATKAPVGRRLEVLSGPERRRRYRDEEKAALVAEMFRPGVCTADIARRHGLHPQQLYTWRRQARRGELVLRDEDLPMFARVVAVRGGRRRRDSRGEVTHRPRDGSRRCRSHAPVPA